MNYIENTKLEYWIGYKNYIIFKEKQDFIDKFGNIPNDIPRSCKRAVSQRYKILTQNYSY